LDKRYISDLPQKNSKKVIVSVLDTKVKIEHEEIKTHLWVNENESPETVLTMTTSSIYLGTSGQFCHDFIMGACDFSKPISHNGFVYRKSCKKEQVRIGGEGN